MSSTILAVVTLALTLLIFLLGIIGALFWRLLDRIEKSAQEGIARAEGKAEAATAMAVENRERLHEAERAVDVLKLEVQHLREGQAGMVRADVFGERMDAQDQRFADITDDVAWLARRAGKPEQPRRYTTPSPIPRVDPPSDPPPFRPSQRSRPR